MTYDINTIYTKYKQLTKKQRQQLLEALQSQGINIVKIEAYEYADATGIKHLFFYFAEDSRKAIPYFMLDSEVWEKIKLSIIKIFEIKNILIYPINHENHILQIKNWHTFCTWKLRYYSPLNEWQLNWICEQQDNP